MSVRKRLDNLNDEEKGSVCTATIYNLIGYFMGMPDSYVVSKEVIQEMLDANIDKKGGDELNKEQLMKLFKEEMD